MSNHTNQIAYLSKHVRVGDTITFWCMAKHKVCEVVVRVLDIYPISDIPPPFVYLTIEHFDLLGIFQCNRIYLSVDDPKALFYPVENRYKETKNTFFVLKCLDDFWYQSLIKMVQLSPRSHVEAMKQFARKKIELNFFDVQCFERLCLLDRKLAFILYGTIDKNETDLLFIKEWENFDAGLESNSKSRKFAVITRQKQTLKRIFYFHEMVEIECISGNFYSVVGNDEKFYYQSKESERRDREKCKGITFATWEKDKKVPYQSPFLIPDEKKELVEMFISRNNKQIFDEIKIIFNLEVQIELCLERDRKAFEENELELIELSKNVFHEIHAGWMEKEGLKSFTNNT